MRNNIREIAKELAKAEIENAEVDAELQGVDVNLYDKFGKYYEVDFYTRNAKTDSYRNYLYDNRNDIFVAGELEALNIYFFDLQDCVIEAIEEIIKEKIIDYEIQQKQLGEQYTG